MTYSLEKIHKEVKTVLQKAETLAKKAFCSQVKISQKRDFNARRSMVTQTDIEIQQLLQNQLWQKFPEIGFILEETTDTSLRKEYNWIIDPLDGTHNFAYKIPLFGISVALWQRNTPLYGIVSFPLLEEVVYGITDKGVFVQSQLKVPKNKPIYPTPHILYGHGGKNQEKIKILSKLVKAFPFPRIFGCATYTGVAVALNRADCAILYDLSLWDLAAVILIAQETGLTCKFISPPPDVFASNVHEYNLSIIIAEQKLTEAIAKTIS